MKRIDEDQNYLYFATSYNGHSIGMRRDKKTGVETINMDDMAKAFGYADFSELLKEPGAMEILMRHTNELN